MPRGVLVVGAGIAGLATALALDRRGHDVVVLERRTRLDEAGAGIQISPNASRILLGLGLGPALARSAVAPAKLAVRRFAEPRALIEMPLEPVAGAPFWVARRADLLDALLDAVRASRVVLRFGRTLSEVAEVEGGVRAVALTDGGARETYEPAVLVGADGIHSAVRPLVAGASPPVFAGVEAWRAMIPAESLAVFAREPMVNLWLGPGAHAVHYPVAGGRYVNLVVVRAAKTEREGWSAAGAEGGLFPDPSALSSTLRDILAAAGNAWWVHSVRDLKRGLPLARGRIALVGDAGHAMLPSMAQGAASALEDAATLAALLPAPNAPGDTPAALARYDTARRTRASKLQATARGNLRAFHARGLFAKARNTGLRVLGPAGLARRHAWIYEWRGDEPHPAGAPR